MSTSIVDGQRTWSMTRDTEGNRTYKIKFLVKGDVGDGPANVIQTPGLPTWGSVWEFDADADEWAFCLWDAAVTPVITSGEPNRYWEAEFTFSTKNEIKRCHEQQVTDPILEPQKVSGSFVKYTEEASFDRFGAPIVNSAWEQLRGPQVEFDASRMSIKIEQNVINLQLDLLSLMMDTVSFYPIWGITNGNNVKLSGASFERKFHGACYMYYTRTLDFDIRAEGFDKTVLDEGTKVLNGKWVKTPLTGGKVGFSLRWVEIKIDGKQPNYRDPTHFIRYQDINGNNTKVILDGYGTPAGVPIDIGTGTGTGVVHLSGTGFGTGTGPFFQALPPGRITIEKYNASDFSLLGIPLII